MGFKRPIYVVVLAVDVTCDGSAEGDEASSGRHGNEVAARDEELEEGVEGGAGLCAQQSCLLVELEDSVQARAVDDGAPGALGGIAVGATKSACNAATGSGSIATREELRYL
jgi:hypothetical protein